MSLPQDAQGVGVVEGDPAFVAVQTHPQPGREGSRVRVRHAAVGVQSSLTVAVAVARSETVSFREKDLTCAHGEKAKRRGVLAVFCPAVMAAVWVTAGRGRREHGIRLRRAKLEEEAHISK